MRIWPGTPLKERDIAETMNISRSPVRLALNRLTEERLISTIPDSRRKITRIYTQKECEDILEMRMILEKKAAFCATEKINPEQKDKLLSIAKEADECPKDKIDTFLIKDHCFHEYLFECSDNLPLLECYHSLDKKIDLMRYYINASVEEELENIAHMRDHITFCTVLDRDTQYYYYHYYLSMISRLPGM